MTPCRIDVVFLVSGLSAPILRCLACFLFEVGIYMASYLLSILSCLWKGEARDVILLTVSLIQLWCGFRGT